MGVEYLTVGEVIMLNAIIIRRYSPDEQIGILNYSLLESAIYRPQQSAFGEDAYPTVYEKAAALFESLGQNHAFCNANKRTAFAAMAYFLQGCLRPLRMTSQQKIDLTIDMVNHKYSFEELVRIIWKYSKPANKEDHLFDY